MAATASPARLGYRPALLPEVGEFVSRTVSRPADSDIRRLAATLHDQTQGNPFFMEEVLRHLVERSHAGRDGPRRTGVLRADDGARGRA